MPQYPNANIPLYDGRRKEMYEAFIHGSYKELASIMYDHADAEIQPLEDCVWDDPDLLLPENPHYGAVQLFKDQRGGLENQQLIHILCAIHRDMIEALILGTMAWNIQQIPDFDKLNHTPVDKVGVWYLTFKMEGRDGSFLSRAEYMGVQNMLRIYHAGQNMKIDKNSTDDQKLWAEVAIAIEIDALSKLGVTEKQVRYSVTTGRRQLADDFTRAFEKSLGDRMSIELDPDGRHPQDQSLYCVGCGRDFIAEQDLASHLRLVLSCIRLECKVEPEAMIVPVLYIWNPRHLELAEAVIARLAGSFLTEGGLNHRQPGRVSCSAFQAQHTIIPISPADSPPSFYEGNTIRACEQPDTLYTRMYDNAEHAAGIAQERCHRWLWDVVNFIPRPRDIPL